MHTPIYLASQSPRRQHILEQMGVAYTLLLPPDVAQAEALEAPLAAASNEESPSDYVCRVSRLKLLAALQYRPRSTAPGGADARVVLCADTTVDLKGQILAKPQSPADATSMLTRLATQTHSVHTAISVGRNAQHARTVLCTSTVRFGKLSPTQIERYVASGEPIGKAGAYAIQGLASNFIEHIEGSYSCIVGLPVYETARLLRHFGVDVL